VTVASGECSIVLTLTREQAEDERVLRACEQDGAPLSGPRLVGPSEWDCVLSVEHVERIELARSAQRATGPSIAPSRGSAAERPDLTIASSRATLATQETTTLSLPSMQSSSWW
jgi:hypothetical protein